MYLDRANGKAQDYSECQTVLNTYIHKEDFLICGDVAFHHKNH